MADHIFLDVAHTLLHKNDLLPTIVRILDGHGIKVDESVLGRRHKLLSELITFPNQTSPEHYLEFNRKLLFSLGIIPCTPITHEIYLACHALEWVAYSDVASLAGLTEPVGIISNWDSTLREKLRTLVTLEFEPVIVSSEVGYRKPNLGIFRLACTELKCPPSQIIHVGDSLTLDVEPALRAGMQAILLDRGNIYPNYTGMKIRSLSELTETIEQA